MITPSGWNSSLNSPTQGQRFSHQTNSSASFSSINDAQNNVWYSTTQSPNLNTSLSSSFPSAAAFTNSAQRHNTPNLIRSSFQTSDGVYNDSNGPIAITFRVHWGGPTTNLIMSRPSVTIMAPRAASFRLGSSSSSSSSTSSSSRGGDPSFATKLDENSSEYIYFQQLQLQDERELGFYLDASNHGGKSDLKDMYIVRVPLTYILSLIDSNSSNSGASLPNWLDTLGLREQLTHAFYSFNEEILAKFNSKGEMLIHQVAVIIEQSISKLWDWYPSFTMTNIMALVLVSEGQLIMVARGNATASMAHLVPLKIARSGSTNSNGSSSNHINENSSNHLVSIQSSQISASPTSGYIGGGIVDTTASSGGFGSFLGAVRRENEVERNNSLLSPSYYNSWTKGAADVNKMNVSSGAVDAHSRKTTGLHVPGNALYGSYHLQEYDSSDSMSFSMQSTQSSTLSSHFPHTTASSGQDILNSGAASIDFSRSVAKANTTTSSNILAHSTPTMTRTFSDTQNKNPATLSTSSSRPDPASIIAPLLALGFSQRQCDAAVLAVKNTESPPFVPTGVAVNPPKLQLGTYYLSPHHLLSENGDVMQNSYRSSSTGGRLSPMGLESSSFVNVRKSNGAMISLDILEDAKDVDSTWGDTDRSMDNGNLSSSATIAIGSQVDAITMVKVLDIPQDMNAFIFHCNASTRDECLERKMFGCV